MKVSEFNQTMAYLLKPKPKMQVAELDSELEKVLQELNEKFGPGTIQEGTQGIPTPPKTIERDMFREAFKADGGRVNLAAAIPLAPMAIKPLAAYLGVPVGTLGVMEASNKIVNYLKENPSVMNTPQFRGIALAFGLNIPGVIAPDADEMEREAEKIREMTKPVGSPVEPPIKIDTTTGETKPLGIEKQKPPVSGTIDIPLTTGGSEIPEQLPIIFENRKARLAKKALEELNPDTVTDISEIVKDYRKSKTRPAGIVTTIEGGRKRERFRPASTQPSFTEDDKLQLVNLVIDKFKEKENKLPSATELDSFLFQLSPSASSIAKKNNINLSKRKADFDRDDPLYIENQRKNKQLKANENNTITNFAGENFFPDTIKLKDGSTVNAEKFFIDNLVKRTESGPSRTETLEITLKNKDLAKLFNTNERKIEEVIKNIRKSPDFTADYPEPRPSNYGQKIALERIKEARKYLTATELANVKLQEQELNKLNTLFKTGKLKVTNYPKLVKALNTTVNKNTGILDHSIKKTKKEMIERSKDNSGLFDISHTIPKTSKQKNIEFLRNRNILDYKTNQGLFKSFEAYVKNQTDDPEYDLRLEEFDAYMKEMGQRVKIGNKFFGLDEAMINSETGEFLGINRQLEYFGLPKFKNGIPLKKIKKALGGMVLDDIGMQEYTEDYKI